MLPYREGGKKLIKEIKLSFVSNWARKEFFSIDAEITRTGALFREYQGCVAEVAAAEATKAPTDDIIKRMEEITASIANIGTADFFTRRYELIKLMLIDNGVNESDKIAQREFWERCVDVDELLKFMRAAVDKDATAENVKKNQMN